MSPIFGWGFGYNPRPMPNPASNKPLIAYDIEVAGLEWEEIDKETRGYLQLRANDAAEAGRPWHSPEELKDKTGLILGLGKIVAIGMWKLQEDQGAILIEGSGGWGTFERFPNSKAFRGTETELLREFWKIAKTADRLISFNGRSYDGPWLSMRSAMLGVEPSQMLMGYRYSFQPHCDLVDVLSFQGSYRENYSLEYWCRRFGIESPKGKLDGSQVAGAYRAGRVEDIGEYCLRDTRATAELYRRLSTTLLPLFQRS